MARLKRKQTKYQNKVRPNRVKKPKPQVPIITILKRTSEELKAKATEYNYPFIVGVRIDCDRNILPGSYDAKILNLKKNVDGTTTIDMEICQCLGCKLRPNCIDKSTGHCPQGKHLSYTAR